MQIIFANFREMQAVEFHFQRSKTPDIQMQVLQIFSRWAQDWWTDLHHLKGDYSSFIPENGDQFAQILESMEIIIKMTCFIYVNLYKIKINILVGRYLTTRQFAVKWDSKVVASGTG